MDEYTKGQRNDHHPGSVPKRRGSPSGGDVMGIFYWIIFLVGIVTWVGVFGGELSNFDSYADQVEQQVTSVRRENAGAVLGVENDESSDVETSATENENAVDDTDVAEVVDEIEEERKQNLRDMLSLDLPKEIENPNYPVTFVEPTKKGVEIQVDGDGFSKKKSPYLLPSLAIGPHTLNFRFEDEDEVNQNLEEELVVIPRAPVWEDALQARFDSGEGVVLSGTATPRSTVLVLVSSELYTSETESDETGRWEVSIEEDLSSGEHIALSFVRKDGYASNFSDPLIFTVGNVEGVSDTNESSADEDVSLEGRTTLLGGFVNVTEENYLYILGGVGLGALVLILIVSGLSRLFSDDERREEQWIEEVKEKNSDKSGLSLREKFARAGIDVKKKTKSDSEIEDSSSVEEVEEEGDGDAPQVLEEDEKNGDENVNEEPESKQAKPKKRASKKIGDNKDDDGPEDEKNKKTPSPKPGKVYSKDEFLDTFKGSSTMGKETKKIKISLTSKDRK